MAAAKRSSSRCGGHVCDTLTLFELVLIARRMEEAQEEPESLTQETIIENMSNDEWKRLSRVRNIGIAVSGLIE